MRSPLHHAPATPAGEKIAQHAHVRLAESNLDRAIEASASALQGRQRPDGHWVFELEADATISAEYVVLQHFLGEPDSALEAKIANYLRRLQGSHGGWPLYYGGELDLSATVKAYLALKLA